MGRKWTPQQKNAVYATSGSVLVSAAAGSGKTSVLVERVIKMVTREENPVDVDRLLVVTFTKAAANEMKERIADALDQRLAENPYDPVLLRQKQLLYAANISTIDSFCGSLVRDYFHVLDISRDYRIGDSGEIKIMTKQALDDTMEYFYAEGKDEFTELLDAFSSKRGDLDLRTSIEKISEFLTTQPFPEKWYEKMLSSYDAESVETSVFGKIIIQNALASAEHALRLNQKAYECISAEPALAEKNADLLSGDKLFITRLTKLLEEGSLSAACEHMNTFVSGRFNSVKLDKDNPIKLRVASIRDSFKSIVAGIKNLLGFDETEALAELYRLKRISSVLFDMVRDYNSRLSELKAKKNVLTFADIELLTVRLLALPEEDGFEKTECAREISERFDYIIIDEFQDVNDVQDVIFRCISRDESNLFVVGDVKQSIYSFRRTRPEIFIERRESYNAFDENNPVYPAAIILDKNFRSREGICKAVNYVFSRLMTRQTAQMDYTREEYLNAGAQFPKASEPEFEFCALEKLGFPDVPSVEMEAEYIAKRILKMLGENYCIKDGDGERRATYGDFAVILRKTKDTAPVYVRVLNDFGIPAYSEKKENVLEAVEIKIILNFLRVIDNPTLEIPLLSVMCSPAYGFTADELAEIKADNRYLNLYNSLLEYSKTSEKARAFVEDLNKLRLYAYTGSVDSLLERIYELTSFEAITSALKGGSAPLRNLEMLRSCARTFEANGYKTLSDFIGYMDRLAENNISLENTSPATEAINAVRVLSVHASKGLEFPVCFLSSCEKQFNERDKQENIMLGGEAGIGIKKKVGVARVNTLPRIAVELENDRSRLAEEMRILYVAMTRAKEKLIAVTAIKDIEKKIQKTYDNLISDEAIDSYVISSCKSMSDWLMLVTLTHPVCNEYKRRYSMLPEKPLDDEAPQMIFNIVNDSDNKNAEPAKREAESARAVSQRDYGELLRKHLKFKYPYAELTKLPQKVTASQIAHGEGFEYFERVLQKPGFLDDGRAATDRGTAHHRFLQFCDLEKARSDVKAEMQRLADEGRLSDTQLELIDAEMLSKTLSDPLFERIISSGNVMREERFTVKIHPSMAFDDCTDLPNEVSVILQGAVDLAFEEDGELIVVDYKTDRVKDMQRLVFLYKKQLELYADAMSRHASKKVKCCILYSLYLNEYVTIEPKHK